MKLTLEVKSACKKFVAAHLPSEAPYFEVAWSAAMGRIGLADLAQASDAHLELIRDRLSALSTLTGLPANLDTRVDYTILVVIACIIELRSRGADSDDSLDGITRLVERIINHSAVPSNVAPLLRRSVPPFIAEVCGTRLPQCSQTAIDPIVRNKWYVEWRLPGDEAPDFGAKTSRQIDKELRNHTSELDLILDERKGQIMVKGWTRSGSRVRRHRSVKLTELQKRHRVMLRLILQALQHGRTIPYDSIVRHLYSTDIAIHQHVQDAIRRTKSDLNSRLDRVFRNVVKAARGLKQYEISDHPFFYYWIRPEKNVSALFRDNA
jgi:hypothetical protein